MSRCRFIDAERGHYPVRQLCRMLGVPTSGYYAWQAGQQPAGPLITPAWEAVLVKAFPYHQRRYGTRRLLRQRAGRKPAKGFGHRWSCLKTEVLELREWPVFADLADAQGSVADYFDYYNHEHLHSSTGYQTPYHAHQLLPQTTALNCPA